MNALASSVRWLLMRGVRWSKSLRTAGLLSVLPDAADLADLADLADVADLADFPGIIPSFLA